MARRWLMGFGFCLLWGSRAQAQVVLTDDAYVNGAEPTSSYRSKTSLTVAPRQTAFFRFDLTHLPPGVTADDVPRATLILWLGSVTTAGPIGVYRVTGAWNEGSLTYAGAPSLGAALSLRPEATDATSNDQAVNWCVVSAPFVYDAHGNHGAPGQPNPACP
jgi:hypothetical protein